MTSQTRRAVTLNYAGGLHARPAVVFVNCAKRFPCQVRVELQGRVVDGKSVIDLLTLAAGPGSTLWIEADGPQADEALGALTALIERDFDIGPEQDSA